MRPLSPADHNAHSASRPMGSPTNNGGALLRASAAIAHTTGDDSSSMPSPHNQKSRGRVNSAASVGQIVAPTGQPPAHTRALRCSRSGSMTNDDTDAWIATTRTRRPCRTKRIPTPRTHLPFGAWRCMSVILARVGRAATRAVAAQRGSSDRRTNCDRRLGRPCPLMTCVSSPMNNVQSRGHGMWWGWSLDTRG